MFLTFDAEDILIPDATACAARRKNCVAKSVGKQFAEGARLVFLLDSVKVHPLKCKGVFDWLMNLCGEVPR